MRIHHRVLRAALAGVAAALSVACMLVVPVAQAREVRVMTSGAFTEAFLNLVPDFERDTGTRVLVAFGASMGGAADSIPSRLGRGEPADVVILAAEALEALVTSGEVRQGSRVDLVRSSIGMAVRAGMPRPDISSVDALRRTLLEANSIAYSASASGVYLSTELFPRLGIADAIKGRMRRIESERVGAVVARGEAAIGFQQVSELLPIAGIDYVGPLPAEAQRVTIFSAGIATRAREPEVAAALIAFLTSPAAGPAIVKSGLEPVASSSSAAR